MTEDVPIRKPGGVVFRWARPEEIDAVAELSYHAFPFADSPPAARARALRENPLTGLYDILVAERDGRLLASARALSFRTWVGGARLGMLGVAGVAVAPEARRQGAAKGLVTEMMRLARGRGDALSSLYAFRHDFYASLGYAHAVERRRYSLSPSDVPLYDERADVRRGSRDDLQALMACYGRVAERSTLMLERSARHWQIRVVDDWKDHVVLAEREGVARGYMVFSYERPDPDGLPSMIVDEAVYEDERALRGLLGYVAGLRDQMARVEVALPASARMELRLRNPRDGGAWGGSISAMFGPRIQLGAMARVIDVPAALRAREGYADASGGLRLCVADGQIEENTWPLDLTFDGGVLEVSEAEEPGGALPPVSIPIGAFTQLYLAFASASELRELGQLEGSDEAVELLDRAFAGPPPALLDWF